MPRHLSSLPLCCAHSLTHTHTHLSLSLSLSPRGPRLGWAGLAHDGWSTDTGRFFAYRDQRCIVVTDGRYVVRCKVHMLQRRQTVTG